MPRVGLAEKPFSKKQKKQKKRKKRRRKEKKRKERKREKREKRERLFDKNIINKQHGGCGSVVFEFTGCNKDFVGWVGWCTLAGNLGVVSLLL